LPKLNLKIIVIIALRGCNMNFTRVDNLSKEQVLYIFKLTDILKENGIKQPLKNKTFILFFPESSIRTRITFEKGIRDLGGTSILFPPQTLDKKEAIKDVVGYIANWADGIIVRHPDIDIIDEMCKYSHIPVINAMTKYNHPCEIMSDLYSISKLRADFLKLNYAFAGAKGNIGQSWLEASQVLGFKLYQICRAGYEFGNETDTYKFSENLKETVKLCEVVLTDGIPEELRNEEYISEYQITTKVMELAQKNAILNPCPPFARGEEVSEEVIDSKYFVGYEFKKNLIYVQQAIILYCCGITLEQL
jgi:ornithine carbamoyltransferase